MLTRIIQLPKFLRSARGGFTHPNGILGGGDFTNGRGFFFRLHHLEGDGAVGTYRVIYPSLSSASWGKSRSPSPHPKSRPSGSAHLRAFALSWPDGVCKLELLELVGIKVSWQWILHKSVKHPPKNFSGRRILPQSPSPKNFGMDTPNGSSMRCKIFF